MLQGVGCCCRILISETGIWCEYSESVLRERARRRNHQRRQLQVFCRGWVCKSCRQAPGWFNEGARKFNASGTPQGSLVAVDVWPVGAGKTGGSSCAARLPLECARSVALAGRCATGLAYPIRSRCVRSRWRSQKHNIDLGLDLLFCIEATCSGYASKSLPLRKPRGAFETTKSEDALPI